MLFYLAEEVNIEWVFSNDHVFCRSDIVCFGRFYKNR